MHVPNPLETTSITQTLRISEHEDSLDTRNLNQIVGSIRSRP